MAEYPNFKHGTRGEINAEGLSLNSIGKNRQAIVYIGTAPVHQVEGGAKNVNRPILARDISEARKYLGYSDDWASYTLCEAMHVHFEMKGVGPLIFINVLDPATHRKQTGGTATLTEHDRSTSVDEVECRLEVYAENSIPLSLRHTEHKTVLCDTCVVYEYVD